MNELKPLEKHNYLFTIKLLDIEPDIWRSFVVPSDITMLDFHRIIKIVMGWTDQREYLIRVGKKYYGEKDDLCMESQRELFMHHKIDFRDAEQYLLGDVIKRKRKDLLIQYLFHRGIWQHELTLESINYKKNRFPFECLDGARACPDLRVDLDSAILYSEYCHIFHDRSYNSPYFEDNYINVRPGFQPEFFDAEAVTQKLLETFKDYR